MPPKAPAAEAKSHWYTNHNMILERVMTIMSGVQEWELEGLRVEKRLSGCTNEEWAEEQRFLGPSPVQLRSQFNVLCGKAMDTARSFLPKTSWTIAKSAPKSWVSPSI